jgi:transposase-like protein
MDGDAFEAWLGAIDAMTAAQRSVTFRMLALAEAKADGDLEVSRAAAGAVSLASDAMETADVGPTRGETTPPSRIASLASPGALASAAQARIDRDGCPHCASRKLQRWGSSAGLPRYRCVDCRRSFNALTGTSLAGLRKKDRWADHAQAMISGETLAKSAKRCGVAFSTAFRWRHRFLAAPALDKPTRLTGIVEADETFILESFKGKRSGMPRPSRKRGGKAKKRGLSKEQIPVLIARDRNGVTTDAVLPKLDRACVTSALEGVVTADNQLCCDGGKAIIGFARKGHIPCCILPSPGGPMRDAPNLHINNVNGYHGRLKEWLRPFHGVATKYLGNYLGWRRTLEALGTGAEQCSWLRSAVGVRVCQQATG